MTSFAARGSGTRSATTSAVGMMEGAFFVSRSELLQWVNNLLSITLTKVEQCASGAVYCQIIDSLRPGSVAMRKVNWMAKSDHEFIPNYKILQAGFDKLNIDKHVEVDRLIRAKYQDNLEFLQWMKCHWEREGGALMQGYDAVQAREGRPMPPWARAVAGDKENLRPGTARSLSNAGAPSLTGGYAATRSSPAPSKPATPSKANTGAARPRSQTAPSQQPCNSANMDEAQREIEALRAQLQARDAEITDLRDTLDGLESERDYYYKKLRDVELLCTELQSKGAEPGEKEGAAAERGKLVETVLDILYREGDDEAEAQAAA
eukprot:TRINITY_DN62702_c0_g1_i1.p1 TRINITY_DN62702_c0_g1~~TRINITY_DN62702_c0_g1_i1.p1  ORF type:complete len:320 (+),score=83.56 TRINITY_DN62702_c0_g1_i1:147-1106(+)